jgi:Prasinovirus endonuclease VII
MSMTYAEDTLFFAWNLIRIFVRAQKKKECDARYYADNREECRKKQSIYSRNHKLEQSIRTKTHYQENHQKMIENASTWNRENKLLRNVRMKSWSKNRRESDLNFRLRHYLSTRIWWAVKGNKKIENTGKLVGCSIPELRGHLEKQFASGMSWSNYGQWHIDHIKPCSKFDLSYPVQQKECFHYTNLQPLWAKDNIRKGAKYEDSCCAS